jgi:hypothetical protein
MRKLLLLIVSLSMVSIGLYLIFVQLFFSPLIFLKIFAGSGMLVFLGLFLLWDDFASPLCKYLFNSKRPTEPNKFDE